jgi:light-regulated signal transduction histidine kinase (bacteriophytochrome)
MMAIYSQMLERRYSAQVDQQARQYLHFIQNGAQRMEALIADILGYAALNQDADLELAPTNVASAIETVRGDLAGLIDSSHTEITVALPRARVMVPERRVAQLFLNLFTNAIKYHKAGHPPRIRVSAQPQGHSWRFRVEDDGIGIAAEYHQEIFQLFKRLHPRDEYEGSGIGLATCQKIVERYGGSIHVESELGQGSAFVFTLPAALEKTGERA